jgi:hypothetical protein
MGASSNGWKGSGAAQRGQRGEAPGRSCHVRRTPIRPLAPDFKCVPNPRPRSGSSAQARALGDLAVALAAAGDHDRAEQLARTITKPYVLAQALGNLAVALAKTGAHVTLTLGCFSPPLWAITGGASCPLTN